MKTQTLTLLLLLSLNLFSQIFDYKSAPKHAPDDVFYIHGLGRRQNPNGIYDYGTGGLLNIVFQVEKVFKIHIEFGSPVVPQSYEFTNYQNIDLDKLECLNYGDHHIYYTNYKMNLNGQNIIGYRKNGNVVVCDLKFTITTLYHELAHVFGLRHCDNSNCIMFVKETGATWFCNRCENLIKHKLR